MRGTLLIFNLADENPLSFTVGELKLSQLLDLNETLGDAHAVRVCGGSGSGSSPWGDVKRRGQS